MNVETRTEYPNFVGFVYGVDLKKDLDIKIPKLIGFGISNAETFNKACEYADGAIIGSAFIKALSSGSDLKTSINQFITSIK